MQLNDCIGKQIAFKVVLYTPNRHVISRQEGILAYKNGLHVVQKLGNKNEPLEVAWLEPYIEYEVKENGGVPIIEACVHK